MCVCVCLALYHFYENVMLTPPSITVKMSCSHHIALSHLCQNCENLGGLEQQNTCIKHRGPKYICYSNSHHLASLTHHRSHAHFTNNTISIRNWTHRIATHTRHIARSSINPSCPPGTHTSSFFTIAAPDRQVSSNCDASGSTLMAELLHSPSFPPTGPPALPS